MATISVSATENEGVSGSTKSTWNFSITGTDFVVSDEDFVIPIPSMSAKYTGTNKGYANFMYELYYHDIGIKKNDNSIVRVLNDSRSLWYWYPNGSWNRVAWASGTTKSIPLYWGPEYLKTLRVSDVFDSTNNTTTKLYLIADDKGSLSADTAKHLTEPTNYSYWDATVDHPNFVPNNIISNIILNKPPTATIDNLSKNTNDYYAKNGNVPVTTVSVFIRDLTVYYGGNLTTTTAYPAGVKFEIGNQSDEAHPEKTDTIDTYHARFANTTLSIDLENPGTFTPKVTVTDSRGQVTERTYNPITILSYSPTTTIQNLYRVKSSDGKLDDEGTNAVIACQFDYPTLSNNYMKKPLVMKDSTEITNNVTWYTSWTANGGFSGEVNFTNYNPTRPVTLYGKITSTLATSTSYKISVACDTTLGPGSYSYQMLAQSFYLLSAAEGGHGLGVGMKVPNDAQGTGLHIGMEEKFHMLITQQVTDKVFSAKNSSDKDIAALYWSGKFMSVYMAGMIQMYGPAVIQTVNTTTHKITDIQGAPDGWLLCDGSILLIEDYPTLGVLLGNTYNTTDADGTTTFALPDFRGRTGIGTGIGTSSGATEHTLGQYDGLEAITLTKDQMPSHTHTQNPHSHTPSSGTNYNFGNMLSGGVSRRTVTTGGTRYSYTTDANSNAGLQFGSSTANATATNKSEGGGAAHSNMQPYVGINYIIATGEL